MWKPRWQRSWFEQAPQDPVSTILSIGSNVVGGLISADSQQSAAETQAAAANNATAQAGANMAQVRADLAPYRESGLLPLNLLQQYGGPPVDDATMAQFTDQFTPRAPIFLGPGGEKYRSWSWDPSIAGLEQTPGYQFTRDQGLKGLTNQFAARGLGISGNAMRAAGDYTTGLAQQTYGNEFARWMSQMGLQSQNSQQLFNMILGNKAQGFNQLLARAQLGQNSAAQTGSLSTAASGQIQSGMIGAGNALAAGQVGAGAALGGGIANAGNALGQYSIYNKLFPSAPAPWTNPDTGAAGANSLVLPGLNNAGGFNWGDYM